MPSGFRHHRLCLGGPGVVVIAALLAGGCATSGLDRARDQFYQAHPQQAVQHLEATQPAGKDEVLVLMERGMARHMAGDYRASSSDFLRASSRLEELDTYSVSKGSATWVINDTVQDFRGKPYERTLLHTFAALDFMALREWDRVAVEARRLIETVDLDIRGDYSDEPFSRYVAGVCFELINDQSSAAFQYRQLKTIVLRLNIDPEIGRFSPTTNAVAQPFVDSSHELIFFFMLGRGAQGSQFFSPALVSANTGPVYAELYARGAYLGRTHTLSDTWHLAAVTEKEEAARKAMKTAARVAVKEAIAESFESTSDELEDLVRLILIGLLEQPDLRAWLTLPRWLQAARVPCPPDLDEYEVVLKTQSGQEISRHTVNQPISRQGRTFVSFHRNL